MRRRLPNGVECMLILDIVWILFHFVLELLLLYMMWFRLPYSVEFMLVLNKARIVLEVPSWCVIKTWGSKMMRRCLPYSIELMQVLYEVRVLLRVSLETTATPNVFLRVSYVKRRWLTYSVKLI